MLMIDGAFLLEFVEDPEMHALIPACCGSFLQPSASAHLRAQVKNGPRDACTYTVYLRAAVGICSLLQVHTSGHR